MANLKGNGIQAYYSELKKFIENQNYGKVVKVSNKIIAEEENEVKAWQCKLTALIHLGEFKEGLLCLKKCKVIDELAFEKSYCEYRLNKTQEAWESIKYAESKSHPRIKELQAQILYRLERYNECFNIYRDLVKSTSDQFDQERLTNLAAVCVNRIYEGSREKGPKPGSDASYEQLYNYSCELLSFGKIQEALKYLNKAETLCKNILTHQEGATDEEVNEEVAIIRVQQGYCLQLSGQNKEALAVYNAVLKTKPDDSALLAVINNNIVTINKEGNLFDSKKRLKTTTAQELIHKLNSRQRASIVLNHCLLAYYTNQEEQVEMECMKLAKFMAQEKLLAALIKAAWLAKAGKIEESAASLHTFAKENQSHSLVALLSASQILLNANNVKEALHVLLSLEEKYKYSSGIVSTVVVLCSFTKDVDLASKVFKEAVEWHKKSKSPTPQLSELWRQAAKFYLRNGDPQMAASFLEELHNFDPSNQNTLAQLISAYSHFDTEMAQSLSKELPDPSSFVMNLDVDALENSFGTKYGRKQVKDFGESPSINIKGGKIESTVISEIGKNKRQKKKRKTRLPKNAVIGEEPDHERWLPKWQRKGYKKRRDRRNKDIMKGTQGVSSDASDKFDITKMAGQNKTSHTQMASPQSESGYKRTFQKKKGKKKKGQW